MSHDDHVLTLAQVADRAGLTLSHVRYYERAGLLPDPVAWEGRGRRYGAGVLARLAAIRAGQEAGLSLGEIRELTALRGGLALDGPRRPAT